MMHAQDVHVRMRIALVILYVFMPAINVASEWVCACVGVRELLVCTHVSARASLTLVFIRPKKSM